MERAPGNALFKRLDAVRSLVFEVYDSGYLEVSVYGRPDLSVEVAPNVLEWRWREGQIEILVNKSTKAIWMPAKEVSNEAYHLLDGWYAEWLANKIVVEEILS